MTEQTAEGMRSVGVEVRNASGTRINPATEETVSQLVMAISNAIDETAFDLNAAVFSETTNITDDYELDSVEFNFTTAASRTITVTTVDGTIILNEASNTDTSFAWQPSSELGFNGGDNLTVDVTQTGSACVMDCILKIKTGTNTIVGNPNVGWVDTNGTELGFKNVDGKPCVVQSSESTQVTKGNIVGSATAFTDGERASVQIDAKGEDIWEGTAAQIPIPAAAGEQLSIVSTDVNDTLTGTGVRKVLVQYLDSSNNEAEEVVDMDGTTAVDLTDAAITFVNHIGATEVGSNGAALGAITIFKKGAAATVYNQISVGGNKSLSAIYKVPAGKTYYMREWHCSVTGNKSTSVRLRSTDWAGTLYAGVFLFKDSAYLESASFDRSFDPPIKIPSLSIVKASAWTTQNGASVQSAFNGWTE